MTTTTTTTTTTERRALTPEEREHRAMLKECLRGVHYGRGAQALAEMRGDRVDESALHRLAAHWHWSDPHPARELIDRLNSRLNGIDPGSPVNWKGLPRPYSHYERN